MPLLQGWVLAPSTQPEVAHGHLVSTANLIVQEETDGGKNDEAAGTVEDLPEDLEGKKEVIVSLPGGAS